MTSEAKRILVTFLIAAIALLGFYFFPDGNTFHVGVETPTPPPTSFGLPTPPKANGEFVWAKNMGGKNASDSGQGYDVAVDSNGYVYVSGGFTGTVDFDPGPDEFNLTSTSFDYYDVFALKLDENGNLIWAKNMGGTKTDFSYDIAVDSIGNVYVMGNFEDTADFDPSEKELSLTSAGLGDVFISKLDEDGNLVWAKRMGGSGIDGASGVAVDPNGNVYLTGYFQGTADFDPGKNKAELTSLGKNDVFVSKLNGNGDFVWAKRMGGTQDDLGYGIAFDAGNNVYTTGRFSGTSDFNPGKNPYMLFSKGGSDIFISKLDAGGNFVWARAMGGASDEQGFNITIDSSGNIYTTGDFWGTVDFDPGIGESNLTSADAYDMFISKLASNGSFIWAKRIGDLGSSHGYDIFTDANGNIYTTGSFTIVTDFDPGEDVYKLAGTGPYDDIFISKLDHDGNFIWAKSTGGESDDLGIGIAVDGNGNIYMTGNFSGTVDFDPGPDTFNLTSSGRSDIFVSKLSGDGRPTFSDVPFDHPQYKYIQALYEAGLTSGCSTDPLKFCPDLILDRAQSAVFMLRGELGADYVPPPAPWETFRDDSWTGFEWAQAWAEGIYAAGLTKGCQTDPLKFCPSTQLPKAEASVFALKMKYGQNYLPPPASGYLFADFPPTDPGYWALDWAEKAYVDGLLPACGTDNASKKPMFCPGELVNRAWGAYLIVKAKGLPVP